MKHSYPSPCGVEKLIGKTLINVTKGKDNEKIVFHTSDDKIFRMFHEQDCCEAVSIEDITGDLQDLVGSPVILAEKVSSKDLPDKEDSYNDSYTWTFYRISTRKGGVVIRWYGSSNGYYSEEVDFEEIK
jgi:hypothetical protein